MPVSTETTLIYDTPNQNEFSHDNTEILIDGTGASLIKRSLTANELLVATGRLTQNSDIGASLPTFLEGNASWGLTNGYDLSGTGTADYISLNDDSGRDGITPLTPTSHFDFEDIGTVRFKMTPQYSGNPASDLNIFSTANSTEFTGSQILTLSGSQIQFRHVAGGDLRLFTTHATDISTQGSAFGSWSPVSGQEYEFEFNYDTSIGASLYIDGVLLGSVGVVSTVNPRDMFVLGASVGFSEAGGASNAFFRDLQIFNTVQHVANFTSEIPRVVNIFPLESRVEPAEFSLVEGFFSSVDVKTLVGTSDVKYTMKIENNVYWFNGGVVLSDGSLAESNTLAELTTNAAAITAFVVSGARFTLQPILSSGPLGLYSPLLVSTTLLYDFFAIPVSCTDCVLYGFVKDNCKAITSGTVTVTTKKPILTQGNIITVEEVVTIDPTKDGFFEVELVIPNFKTTTPELANGSQDVYDVLVEWIDSDGDAKSAKYKVLIPNQTSVLFADAVALADAL